jgi:predicted RND superfamily exporter protein
MNEDDARAVAAESEAGAASLEKTMNELESKNGELSSLKAEVEDLKGKLSVYKEKLDELLSTEAVEHAAMDMMAEADEAGEIIQNSIILNENGEDDEKKKDEIMNSIRPEGKVLYGETLYATVLNSIGVNTKNMSKDAMHGAFKAQAQIANAMKGKRKHVAGDKLNRSMIKNKVEVKNPGIKQRTALEKMGFKKKA